MMLRIVALIQGFFYLATGVWPLLDIGSFQLELIVLAVGCALGLATIDLVYALSGGISAVYLADAAVELGLASIWGFARLRA
jgi:hypothetical protein